VDSTIVKQDNRSDERSMGLSFIVAAIEGFCLDWEIRQSAYLLYSGFTIKQMRHWVSKNTKDIKTSDEFNTAVKIIDGTHAADSIEKVEALNALREEARWWFGKFHPTDRQWKIIIIAFSEVADRFLRQLAIYYSRNSMEKLTINWEVESLPDDGGIYRTLLQGGKM
jgi:hypothetical protein